MGDVKMVVDRTDMARLLGLAEPACPADEALLAQLRAELQNTRQGVVLIRQIDLSRLGEDDIPY